MKRFPVAVLLSVLAIGLIIVAALWASAPEDGTGDRDYDPAEVEVQPDVPMAPAAVDTEALGADEGSSDYPDGDGRAAGSLSDLSDTTPDGDR